MSLYLIYFKLKSLNYEYNYVIVHCIFNKLYCVTIFFLLCEYFTIYEL